MFITLRDWWRQLDHYYWLTAFLAARGAQTHTCRLIAAALASLAGVVIASLGSPAGPHGDVGRLVAIGVAVVCVLMALTWLRQGWPSRAQSTAFVIVSALCIATVCLVQADPVNGMFAATTFAVLSGYIAFFHTPRLMTLNFLVGGATAATLAVRLVGSGDTAIAVSALMFLTVVNFAAPLACQALVHLLGVNVANSDIEPLTGLLNREAFLRAVAALIASRNRDDDRFLVVAIIELDNFGLLTHTDGRVSGARARVAVGQTMRETTRSNAVVAHVPDSEFLIADSFPTSDSSPLVERVLSAIRTTPPRTSASIGVVSIPMQGLAELPPDDLLDELIDIARSAMRYARRAGGDQAHYVISPSLSALDGDEPSR